jgi:hypothetical protein
MRKWHPLDFDTLEMAYRITEPEYQLIVKIREIHDKLASGNSEQETASFSLITTEGMKDFELLIKKKDSKQ